MDPVVISARCQEFQGARYYLCGHYFQHRGSRLHRAVWQAAHGPIPPGHHVHHVNGDRADNRLANLDLRTAREHLREHMGTPERREQSRRSIAAAIEEAPKWHRSESGVAWHADHAKRQRHHTDRTLQKRCAHCGLSYLTTRMSGAASRFCGNNCRAAWRRAAGIDREERKCVACGSTFTVDRYQRTRACSRSCGAKARRCN